MEGDVRGVLLAGVESADAASFGIDDVGTIVMTTSVSEIFSDFLYLWVLRLVG